MKGYNLINIDFKVCIYVFLKCTLHFLIWKANTFNELITTYILFINYSMHFSLNCSHFQNSYSRSFNLTSGASLQFLKTIHYHIYEIYIYIIKKIQNLLNFLIYPPSIYLVVIVTASNYLSYVPTSPLPIKITNVTLI